MSLNLSFGGGDDPAHAESLAALNRALARHGQPPHAEPAVELQVWSVKRRVIPLDEAAEARGDRWAVLTHINLNDSVLVPRATPVLRSADHGTVASLPGLLDDLARLLALLDDPEDPAHEAAHLFQHAAMGAARAGCALWLC